MDIQKEKDLYLAELLEREVIKKDEFEDIVFKTEINAFHSCYLSARFMDNINFGWSAWQAAKSQAVPEGFVLVPRELSDEEARKYAEALFHKVEDMAKYEHRDLSESEFESFKNRWLDARTLTIQFDWKEMIEAQEQSHDSPNP